MRSRSKHIKDYWRRAPHRPAQSDTELPTIVSWCVARMRSPYLNGVIATPRKSAPPRGQRLHYSQLLEKSPYDSLSSSLISSVTLPACLLACLPSLSSSTTRTTTTHLVSMFIYTYGHVALLLSSFGKSKSSLAGVRVYPL